MERNKVVPVTILLILLGLIQVKVYAQDLIFEKQNDSVPHRPGFGPNRKHFYHAFLASSLFLQNAGSSGIVTNQPFTGQFTLGFRYKFKIARPIALVSECGINRNFFRISQTGEKSFPDTFTHQSQAIRVLGLFGGAFLRLRLGQRGDYLGTYIDLGLSAQASLKNQLVTKDLVMSSGLKPFQTDKTTVSVLRSINLLTYKASARIGFDRFSLFASYRLSRLIDESSVLDLPNLELGMEISPVRY